MSSLVELIASRQNRRNDRFVFEEICMAAAARLYRELRDDPRLAGLITFKHPMESFCFRGSFSVKMPVLKNDSGDAIEIEQISIAYAPDKFRHIDEEPTVIETMIVSSNGLDYITELGYDDVRNFYSADDVVKEILRIIEFSLKTAEKA